MGFVDLVLRPLRRPRATVAYPAGLADAVHSERTPRFRPEQCDDNRRCQKVCPAGAITIEPDGERGRRWSLDYGVCVFCGECISACPTSAIAGTGDFELAAAARKSLAPVYMLGERRDG